MTPLPGRCAECHALLWWSGRAWRERHVIAGRPRHRDNGSDRPTSYVRYLPHACTARAGVATAPTGRASRGGWLRSLAGLPRTRLAPVEQREMA